MKRTSRAAIGWTIVAVVAFSTSTMFAIWARMPSSPGLTAMPNICAFGEVREHTVLRGSVRLANEGATTLELHPPRASCACAIAQTVSGKIMPGEIKEIHVEWHVGSRRGEIRDSLLVRFDEPTTGRRGLMIVPLVAHVVPDIPLDPERLTFSRNNRSIQRLTALAPADSVVITNVISSHRCISANVVNANTVEVTFEPANCPEDVGGAELTVRLRAAEESRIRVPVEFR